MGPEFFQTGMGRKFYEADVPRIAKGIERLAEAIEKQNALMEAANAKSPDSLKTLVGPFMASSASVGGASLQHDAVCERCEAPAEYDSEMCLCPKHEAELAEAGKPLTKASVSGVVADILLGLQTSAQKRSVLEITDPEMKDILRRAVVRLELSKHHVMVNVSPVGGKMTVERM